MDAAARGPDPATLTLFAFAVVLGGSNFLAVRLSNLGLPPFWGAGLRFSLAAFGLFVLVATLRLGWPGRRVLVPMAAYGVPGIGAFYAPMYRALLTVTAVALTVGGAALLALSAAVGEPWSLPRRPEAAWALAYLVTLGSVGLFLALLTVVRRWTASASAFVFVLLPVAKMVLEAPLLGEPIRLPAVGAALVVIAGVWIGALAPDPGSAATARP